MAKQNIQTFRPYLTLAQIEAIIEKFNADPKHPEANGIVKALTVLHFKARMGNISAAHVRTPRQSLEESLGFGPDDTDSDVLQSNSQRHQVYEKYLKAPALCTEDEVKIALTFKYENDLMSPEEEAEFESSLL